ncbi:hypothetical protein [Corallococcus silvisoli]|uniref:hypothetical protein n=1 Tax=Corallococcus silvisoli TaxID=2697031 RepID=UPI001377599E|nr:hypothetical protein [Corallococcus silvisoli]NBD08333.1 hypothetical protein [Corallococcus silvisoli]
MNLFELAGLLGAGVGLVTGAWLGHDHAGTVGLMGGAVAGVVGGFASGIGAVAGMFGIAIFQERWTKRFKLAPRFRRYWARRQAASWAAVKDRLVGGETVRGRVVLEAHYGRFLDLGVGFPALLQAVDSGGLVSDLPHLGDDAEAVVLEFDDADQEIVLTRSHRWWLAMDGVPVGYLASPPPEGENGSAYYFALTNSAHAEFRERLAREQRVTCSLIHAQEEPRSVWIEQGSGRPGGSITMRPR